MVVVKESAYHQTEFSCWSQEVEMKIMRKKMDKTHLVTFAQRSRQKKIRVSGLFCEAEPLANQAIDAG